MNRFRAFLVALPLLTACLASPAAAQYPFGKNKVLYVPKDWKVLETRHVEIYYYPDELPVALFIASMADSVYREFSSFLRVEFDHRIPVILYGTHHDFQETNVTPYLVSESTAGFTEFVKGRIALPFAGSYPKLEHVFRHEMVHAIMIEKLRVVMTSKRRWGYQGPPLWFVEGLAEYLARGETDSEAHMFLRDAATSGLIYSLEEIWRIEGSYLMYKEGESAVAYIATRYGDEALVLMLENWWRYDRFPVLVERTLGVPLRELSQDWIAFLQRRYYPAVLDRRAADEIGKPLSEGKALFEMHPACAPAAGVAGRVYCVGYDRGSINILEMTRDESGRPRRSIFVRGGTSRAFESIPTLRSRLFTRGDTLLFVSKRGERDAIYVYSISRRRILRALTAPETRIINSPSLSPDGRRIVFSAIDGGGKSDLFTCDLPGGSITRITDDFYDDTNPDWHPTLPLVVWSSNRCSAEGEDAYALYTMNPDGGPVSAVTGGGFRDVEPRWLPDGSGVIFSSDRDGTPDIYCLRGEALTRQTSLLGGAYSPYPCGDGTFLCASYTEGGFRTYRMPFREAPAGLNPAVAECDSASWDPGLPPEDAEIATRDYRMKLGLDFIAATFALDPDFGGVGNGAQLFFTDILGNHQFIGLIGAATDNFEQIIDKLNVAVTYVNLSHRLNYALGAFRLASYIGYSFDLIRYERRTGVTAALLYPLSTFTRVGVSAIVRNMEREDDFTWLGQQQGSSWLVSNYALLTYDNIVWYIGGPLYGRRLNISLGNTLDLSGSRYESRTLSLDFRHYFPITDRVIIAQRFVTRNAWGSDLQLYYLGGSWDLHGYRFRQFAGTRTLLVNTELRFPLIDRFVLKFPVGLIELPLFRGSLFLDAARVSGFLENTGWIGSMGGGVELNLGYLPVARVNFSRLTDFNDIERGWHVDLFLGFNF